MEEFDYEKTFMGVPEKGKLSYKKSFIEDYRLKRLTEVLQLKKGKLLDIGCGGGITTEALQYYYPNVSLYGCDISSKALSYAKKLGSGNVSYKKIENKRLPYKDNYFDACIALDVMEHISDVDFFLKEVRRVLKKDGAFFSHTPTEDQPLTHTWLWGKIKHGNKMTFKRYGHIHPEFTHSLIQNKIKKEGFKIIKINYSEHIVFQFLSLLLYFLPLEILELILNKKADFYKDKGIIIPKSTKRDNNRYIIYFRNLWIYLTYIARLLTYWELELFKFSPIGALKINILAVKK